MQATPIARPAAAPLSVWRRLYIHAAGSTNAQVDSTFMNRPMGPVSLTVTISTSETSSEIPAPANGPSRKPPMAMTMSFGS